MAFRQVFKNPKFFQVWRGARRNVSVRVAPNVYNAYIYFIKRTFAIELCYLEVLKVKTDGWAT